jgi:restriction endonuclease S subunit
MAVWSIVLLTDLSKTLRFDAEYYKPEYLDNIDFILHKCPYPVRELGDLILSISGGATPDGADYQKTGIPFLRVQNIMPNYLNLEDVVYIYPEVHNGELQRSRLFPGDVLLTITGVSYGKSAYVPLDLGEANINQHSVRMSFVKELLPEYISTFLNCKYGKLQSDMKITGVTRPALDYGEIQTILIPVLPLSKQISIEQLVKKSEECRKKAKILYDEAENLLFHELGLDNLDLSTQKTYIANFSETVEGDRFDAEYFQPKYYRVLDAIKSTKPKEIIPFGILLDSITNGQTPLHHNLSQGDITFLTAEHIFDFRINYDSEKRVLNEHHQNKLKKTQLHESDILITIKGRVGNAAVVENLSKSVNINQDVALLRLQEKYNPYYISGFINSIVGKALTEQISTGQINPFLGLGKLQQLPIPIFETSCMDKIGEKIKQKIHEAFQMQQEAENLLEEAKHRVEQMILGEKNSKNE